MKRPHIYIHRVMGCPYEYYMDAENEALLASWAEVTNNGNGAEPVPPEEMARVLRGVDGILSLNGSGAPEITTEALREAGTVKVAAISHWWHGSHDAAVPMWRAAGVEVMDVSDGCNEAVAEWTLGAAIAGLRRFEHFDREMKSGVVWPQWRGVAGQLTGSTFGIVGLGRVGRLVAKLLQPFRTRVIAYDAFTTPEQAAELGVELVDLDTLLRTADAISLHIAVTPETTGMIGAREFSLIKDGALFINSARAALLDNDAFRAELAKKRFRAYLDVYQPEPPPADDILRTLDNVVLTPHVAGTTDRMFLDCGRRAIEALREYLPGFRRWGAPATNGLTSSNRRAS